LGFIDTGMKNANSKNGLQVHWVDMTMSLSSAEHPVGGGCANCQAVHDPFWPACYFI